MRQSQFFIAFRYIKVPSLLLQSSQVRLDSEQLLQFFRDFYKKYLKPELDYNLHSGWHKFHVQWANMMFG
jgi:hypothetical protein